MKSIWQLPEQTGVEHLLHASVVTASGLMLAATDLIAVAPHLDHIPEGITR